MLPTDIRYDGAMSELGQEKNSVRAYVLRFTLKLGHHSTQSACLKRATHRRVSGSVRPPITFRSAFLRDCCVCFHNGIVESPTGNRAHTIETGEDA